MGWLLRLQLLDCCFFIFCSWLFLLCLFHISFVAKISLQMWLSFAPFKNVTSNLYVHPKTNANISWDTFCYCFLTPIHTKQIKKIIICILFKLFKNSFANFFGILTAVLILAVVIFAPNNMQFHEYNKIESSIFLGFHRTAWALALSWIIYACVSGRGGKKTNIIFLLLIVYSIITTYLRRHTFTKKPDLAVEEDVSF